MYTVKIDSSFGFGEVDVFEKCNMRYAILNNKPIKISI